MRALALASLLFAFPAIAGAAPASGAQILAAITGNTVQGSMDASGAYTEFYQADGIIKGSGYTGSWLVAQNRMCFAYEGTPTTCFAVEIDGEAVTWIGDKGERGTGTILKGNPNGF
mgnify:CR=1 FL=1|jgi:hypothetical protein